MESLVAFFDLVEKDDGEFVLGLLPLGFDRFLVYLRLHFPAHIAGRGADKLGDFMRVLKLRAVNLYEGDILNAGESFGNVRLAASRWAHEQKDSERLVWGGEAGDDRLLHSNELLYGSVLSCNLGCHLLLQLQDLGRHD